MLTDMARLGRIAFVNNMQLFPKAQTLIFEHLHKAVEPPIIVDHTIADAPFVPLLPGLMLLLFDDHLPLGKIADHHSPFSQSVRDEMGGFMQTVLLFTTLLLRNPLVHLGEMDVAAGFLLALVSFGANLIELLVVPPIPLEPTDMVEAPLVVVACCQGLDTQVKGHNAILAYGVALPFFPLLARLVLIIVVLLHCILIHKGPIVVPTCIPGHRYLMKMIGWFLCEMRDDVGITFGSPAMASSCRKRDGVAHDRVQVHGWIAERKELVPGFHAREPWFPLSCCYTTKEALHRMIQAEEHFLQELAVNGVELRVVFPARSQRLLCLTPAGPSLPAPQLHHPPIV